VHHEVTEGTKLTKVLGIYGLVSSVLIVFQIHWLVGVLVVMPVLATDV
jgi:hypothetical protein